mgnify:CR=1 FL=1
MFRTFLATALRNGRSQQGGMRLSIGSIALASIGMVITPCMASDQDQACAEAMARSHQVIQARYGPVVDGVELADIDHWETTPYHPGSEQLAFLLRSRAQGSGRGTNQASARDLMADRQLQARLSLHIVKACPGIDVVSYRLEERGTAISYSREINGLSRRESTETIARAPMVITP